MAESINPQVDDEQERWFRLTYEPFFNRMIFKPTPDITSYELARIVQLVSPLTKTMSPRQVDELPRELQRHWRQAQ